MRIPETETLIRFVVLTAGKSDEYRDRALGPIHIIKYIYLADLAYAETKQGQTYTGINWKFHHFGPWSLDLYQRIEPALSYPGVNKHVFDSQYDEKDCVRWTWQDDENFRKIEANLPLSVSLAIQRSFREFGTDTFPLLHHVYRTEPMIHAAPEEYLDFSYAIVNEPSVTEKSAVVVKAKSLSLKKSKARDKRLDAIRDRVQAKWAEKKKSKRVKPNPAPRYDEVYFQGLKWIESLSGEPVSESFGELIIDDSIWKHPGRTESDVP